MTLYFIIGFMVSLLAVIAGVFDGEFRDTLESIGLDTFTLIVTLFAAIFGMMSIWPIMLIAILKETIPYYEESE